MIRMLRLSFAALVAALLCVAAAVALDPDEQLDDPALEARAREISKELRCVVCQSQSIDESRSPLAKDLRVIVRERLVAGDTNEEVVAYVVDRYGDYVLLAPPMRGRTALLWLGPALIALAGAGLVALVVTRARRGVADDGETDGERDA